MWIKERHTLQFCILTLDLASNLKNTVYVEVVCSLGNILLTEERTAIYHFQFCHVNNS